MTTVLPQTRAGINFQEGIAMGKFHGVIKPHTPTGCRTHIANLFESSDGSLRSLIRLTAEAQRILSDVYHPDGFNIGMNFGNAAGAGFADHYHVHVVPRWGGDVNFMTVTARTRLVPEDLNVTFDKLRAGFADVRKETLECDE